MNHSSVRNIAVAFVVVVAAVMVSARMASGAMTEVVFADVAAQYAVDPQSGNIAAVDPVGGKVVLYGPKLSAGEEPKPIASVAVAGEPFSIVFKQVKEARLFAVGCKTEKSLYLFDAATLKQTAKIDIAGNQVPELSTSRDPDDPYLYYFCHKAPHDNPCGRVHVVKQVDEGDILERGDGDAYDGAISARGNFFYKRGGGSPPGMECFEKFEPTPPETKTRFRRAARLDGGGWRYVCDPFEAFTACGPFVYTARLDRMVGNLPFEVHCFSDSRPWVAGLQGYYERRRFDDANQSKEHKLMVASTNTFKTFAELTLPESFTRSRDDDFLIMARRNHEPVGYRVGMVADSVRERILVFRGNRVLVVPTADLKLPDEPLLVLHADTRTPLTSGRKNVVELALKDPRTKVELLDTPGGLELTAAGALEWTPKPEVVGLQSVRLKLSVDIFERTETLRFHIDGSFIPLPAVVNRLNLSHDGKSLVAWRNANGDIYEAAARDGKRSQPQCALIDPIERKVRAVGPLPFYSTESMTADAHFVYVSEVNTPVLTILDRGDLTMKKQITLDDKITWIRGIDNKAIVVGLHDGRWLKYSVPDFKFIAQYRNGVPPGNRALHSDGQFYAPMRPVVGGWRMHTGDVFDPTFSKLTLLRSIGGIKSIGRLSLAQQEIGRDNNRTRIGMTEQTGGGSVAIINAARFGSPEKTVVLLRTIRNLPIPGRSGDTRAEGVWSLQDRSQPQEGREVVLTANNLGQSYLGDDAMRQRSVMLAGRDRIITAFDGKVFQTPLSELIAGEADPEPATIKPVQSSFTADVRRTTTLKHEFVGGKPPATFALVSPMPGLVIDPTDGTVTVDGPAVMKEALDQLCGRVDGWAPHRFNDKTPLNTEMLAQYLFSTAATHEEITGTKPTGVPIALAIGVQATDAQPRIATISYFVLLDLPRKEIDDRLAAAEAAYAKLREAQLAERRSQERRVQFGGRGEPEVSPETQAYIRRLEQRLMTLETQLNILSKMLKK